MEKNEVSYFEQMDYFEQQQQLIKSPIKYREKETVYLFLKSDKEYTFKNGVCDEWEQEFEFLKILMRKLNLNVDTVNKKDFFSTDTVSLIGEINNWLKWILNWKYDIPNSENEKKYVFNVNETMDKKFYTIAKVCDNACDIEKTNDGYRVCFTGKQLHEIEMMYFLRAGWEESTSKKVEGEVASYLVKYSELYRTIISSRDVLAQVENIYGYYNIPKKIKEDIFYNMQNKTRVFQQKANALYTNMLLERRVNSKWSNEYRLFELIHSYNKCAEYQYHCEWLGSQSLDIYIDTEKVGIEYQGEQHYKPIKVWGGEDSLKKIQKRDLRKKKLCAENGIRLLECEYTNPVNSITVLQFMKEHSISICKNSEEKTVTIGKIAPVIKKENKKKVVKKKRENYYILKYDLKGNYIDKYYTIKGAADAENVSQASISKVLRGMRNSAGGYIWKKVSAEEQIQYHIEVTFDISKVNTGLSKQIALIDKNGRVCQIFPSIASAAKLTRTSLHHIEDELEKENSKQWKYL